MATTRSKVFEVLCEVLLSAQAAAYVPSTPYTGSLPKGVVKKGDKGSDVKNLQKFLNWCMNPKTKLVIDGKAGSKTISLLKKWQKAYGQKADGIFGPKSKKKAQSIVNAHKPKPKPTPKPDPKPTPTLTNAEKIALKAEEFAWPYGTATSVYAYKKGRAKSEYKTALRKYMGKKAKVSQTDCGYFASTCARAPGVASNFLALPSKASQPYPALPSSLKIVHEGTIGTFQLKRGDFVRWRKSNNHQHVIVYLGDGKFAHASREHAFPRVSGSKPWTNSNVKQSTIQVLRAK